LIYTRQYCTTVEEKVLCYIEQEGRISLFTHPHALKTGLLGPLGQHFPASVLTFSNASGAPTLSSVRGHRQLSGRRIASRR